MIARTILEEICFEEFDRGANLMPEAIQNLIPAGILSRSEVDPDGL